MTPTPAASLRCGPAFIAATLITAAFALSGCEQLCPACQTYSLEVRATLPDDVEPDSVDLYTAIYAPQAGAEVRTCSQLEWGENDVFDLRNAQVGRAPIGDPKGVADVPRLGDKLVVVEGIHPQSEERELIGCAELGDIDAELVVEVTLDKTAALDVFVEGDSLAAFVPFDGPGRVEPRILVAATDSAGDPRAGAPIRVVVRDADGAILDTLGIDEDLVTDAQGGLVLTPDVDTFGPFTVEVLTRHPIGDPAEPLEGFGVPAQTVVEPFGDATVFSTAALRMGPSGVAFFGLVTFNGMLLPEPAFATPNATLSDGLPTFTVHRPSGTLVGAYRALAAVHNPQTGDDAALLLRSSGGVWLADFEQARLLAEGDSVVAQVDGEDVTLAEVRIERVIPLGSCSASADAAPVVMVVSVPTDANSIDERAKVFTVAFNPFAAQPQVVTVDVGGNVPLLSMCLKDLDGDQHRIALLRARDTGETIAVDFGDGIDGMEEVEFIANALPVPGAVAVGPTGDRGAALFASVGGFTVRVEELVLAEEPDQVFAPPTFRYGLPASPRLVGSASLFGPGRRDDFALLNVGSIEEDDSQANLLYVVTSEFEAGKTTPVRAGGLPIPSCSGLARCTLVAADADDDGMNEIYLGREPRSNEADREIARAEVVRFTR